MRRKKDEDIMIGRHGDGVVIVFKQPIERIVLNKDNAIAFGVQVIKMANFIDKKDK